MKLKKGPITFLVVVILLIAAVGYIIVDTLGEAKAAKELELLQTGYNQGVQDCNLQTLQAIVNDLNKLGYTQIVVPVEGNKTQTLKLVPQFDEQQNQQQVIQPSEQLIEESEEGNTTE